MKNNLMTGLISSGNCLVIRTPILKALKGDWNSSVLLSQLCYWDSKTKKEWIYKTYNDWEKEIFLTKYKVDKSKTLLKRLGLIDTKIKKANGSPTVHYKVLIDNIIEFLNSDSKETSLSIVKKLDYPKSRNLINDNKETSLSLTETTTETTPQTTNRDYITTSFSKMDTFNENFFYALFKKITRNKNDKIMKKLELSNEDKLKELDDLNSDGIITGSNNFIKMFRDYSEYYNLDIDILKGLDRLDYDDFDEDDFINVYDFGKYKYYFETVKKNIIEVLEDMRYKKTLEDTLSIIDFNEDIEDFISILVKVFHKHNLDLNIKNRFDLKFEDIFSLT